MSVKPVAVLSDIHGNRWALEAVLRDIARRGIERVVNLGDSLYGPLDVVGTAEILMGREIPTVRGNEDRILIQAAEGGHHAASAGTVRDRLRREDIEWLGGLEMTATAYGGFFLCHGTPERDDEYLLQEVLEGRVRLRSPEELEARVGALVEPVVLCGHDHIARTVYLPSGKLVVNPGSVGLPAYRDDVPYRHAMESGTPHARYSIVWWRDGGWEVEEELVAYEWEEAAEAALRNGRPDWAGWLRTGKAVASPSPRPASRSGAVSGMGFGRGEDR